MKTAFITLVVASLFTLAYGSPVLTLDSEALQLAGGSYSLTEGINSGYGNFSVTMALDAQAFQSAILAGDASGTIFTANNNYIGLGIGTTPNAGLYGSWLNTNYTRAITPVNNSAVNLSSGLGDLFSSNTYESIAVTYQITSTGTWTYLTLVDSEGTASTYGGNDSGLKAGRFGALTSFTYGENYVKYLVVDNQTLSATASQKANLSAIAAAAVPEPAAASLSLIGLAALMMRRRRACAAKVIAVFTGGGRNPASFFIIRRDISVFVNLFQEFHAWFSQACCAGCLPCRVYFLFLVWKRQDCRFHTSWRPGNG